MRILAITYCFTPFHFPATFRLLKWCRGLTELGHQITIVAVHPESFRAIKDLRLDALVPDGVERVYVKSPENALHYRALRRLYRWTYPLFEPRKKEWLRAATRATMALQPSRFDVLFSCSQPAVCHVVGREVARRTRLPWVAFFSDPWVDNPMSSGVPSRIQRYNAALEREVIREAQRLVFPSAELVEQVSERYATTLSARAVVLPHSYVSDWYRLATPPLSPRGDGIRIVCMGSFYKARTPQPLLEALRCLKQRAPTQRFQIDMFGHVDPACRQMLQEYDLKDAVTSHGSVGYLESLAIMKAADYLLLIDAPLGGAKQGVFLPSKLIDYLGAGRPILGVTPLQGAAARVLSQTGNVVCDLYNPRSLAVVFESILNGTFSASPRSESASEYDYRRVTQRLVRVFEDAQAAGSHARAA